MRRLLLVAKKDFRDAMRDRQLYGAGALFLLVGAGLGYLIGSGGGQSDPSILPQFTLTALVFLGALTAISLSFNGIVGKRGSGELRVLLSLPFSRREVVYGTLLGRFALLTLLSVSTLALATVLGVALGASVAFDLLAFAMLAAVLVVAVFVSVSVGLSAASKNSSRASMGAFGLFILLLFRLWEAAPLAVRYVLNGFSLPSPGTPTPTWALAWGQISPLAAIKNLVSGIAPELVFSFSGFAPTLGPNAGDPVFVQAWFGAVVVVVWIAGPVTLGYVQLTRSDL